MSTATLCAFFYLAVGLLITPGCFADKREGTDGAAEGRGRRGGVEIIRRCGSSLEYCNSASNELHRSCWLITLRRCVHTASRENYAEDRG